jgi:hypothetical protein
VVDDRDTGAPVRVAQDEMHTARGVGVATRRDHRADEDHVLPGVVVHLRREDLGNARAGERRVDDEDGECGRHGKGDYEPRRI